MMESVKAGWEEQLDVAGLEGKADAFKEVFSNGVVWSKIVEDLSFGDMKASSQVCRLFLQMVRGTRRFKETAVLVVCSQNEVLVKKLNVMEGGIWRSLKMDVSLPSEVVDGLLPFLEHVECLALLAKAGPRTWNRCNEEEYDESQTFILRVLRCVPNIKHLQIDWNSLENSGLSEAFASPGVQKNLQKLKKLDICKWEWNDKEREYTINNARYRLDSFEATSISRHLEPLAIIPMSLETFTLGKAEGQSRSLLQLAQVIVDRHKETLEALSVHLDVWQSDAFGAVTLPVLKSLTVVVNPEEQNTLAQFLRNHLTLEELDVGTYTNFNRELSDAIRECSVHIRKLHLRGKNFDGELDWSFLGFMNRLKEFQLVKTYRRRATLAGIPSGPEILAALPTNQLECLSLRGLSALHPKDFRAANNSIGFWRRQGEAEVELDDKKELFKGFTNLKKLNLERCYNCVNDDLMQFILEEFQSLEELTVSHCSNLTNAGMTGVVPGGLGTGVSLARLTGLKSLSIRACPQVTLEGLLPSLILPNLKFFDYLNRENVADSLVLEIVAQIPSLETLNLPFASHSGNLQRLEGKNRRFPKLNEVSWNWIEEDEDSDADDPCTCCNDDQDDYTGQYAHCFSEPDYSD